MSEPPLPLSRRLDVAAIPATGVHQHIVADEAERAALAKAYGLQAVESLSAELEVARWRGEGVSVRGHLSARIVQTCVVSLEPVPEAVEEDLSLHLVPEGSRLAGIAGDSVEIAPTGEDPPDVFAGRAIDLGAILAEHLALAMNPYPRAAGAELPAEARDPDAGDSPFAALAGLAGRRRSAP